MRGGSDQPAPFALIERAGLEKFAFALIGGAFSRQHATVYNNPSRRKRATTATVDLLRSMV